MNIKCWKDGELTWVEADKFDKFGWKGLAQTLNENKADLALPKTVVFLSKNKNSQKFECFFGLQAFSENPTLPLGNLNENKHAFFGHIWLDKRGHLGIYLFIYLFTDTIVKTSPD